MSDRCKNCGYCPHCGRSDKVYPRPWYPQPYPWSYQTTPRQYPYYGTTSGKPVITPCNTSDTSTTWTTTNKSL